MTNTFHIQVCMKKSHWFLKKLNKHWIKAHTRLAKGHTMHFGFFKHEEQVISNCGNKNVFTLKIQNRSYLKELLTL